MYKMITILFLLLPSLCFGDSYLSYSQGKFDQAFMELKTEIKVNKIENLENALDMAQDIWGQSSKMPLSDIMEVYDLVRQHKLNSYMTKRVDSDIKYLAQWKEIKNLSKEELTQEIKRLEKLPDDVTNYNHDKKSKIRVYKLRLNALN